MPELRWTLLILGALFIGALALWELRRQKHARGLDGTQGQSQGQSAGHGPGHNQGQTHPSGHAGRDTERERISPTFDGLGDSANDSPARGVFREPTLTLPDVHFDGHGDLRERAPICDPRVVELDDESLAELKVDRQEVVDEFSTPMRDDDDEEREDADEEEEARVEPMIPELSAAEMSPAGPAVQAAEPLLVDEHDAPTTQYRVSEDEGEHESEREPAVAAASHEPIAVSPTTTTPIVDWPDEDSRKIIALRLVSGAGERFAGRNVRLALAAEGFLLGKFDIFHKPGPDSRAVLSAASLTKPGTFSLDTMDAQRFGGISLFAVLPGPLSPIATFDELLTSARALNDRLRGALQDERGEPLTPMRSTSIRDSLAAAASAAAPVVGAAGATTVGHRPGDAGPA